MRRGEQPLHNSQLLPETGAVCSPPWWTRSWPTLLWPRQLSRAWRTPAVPRWCTSRPTCPSGWAPGRKSATAPARTCPGSRCPGSGRPGWRWATARRRRLFDPGRTSSPPAGGCRFPSWCPRTASPGTPWRGPGRAPPASRRPPPGSSAARKSPGSRPGPGRLEPSTTLGT